MANENEPIGGFAAFWSKYSKKIEVSVMVLLGVVLLAVGGYWLYQTQVGPVKRDYIATFDGKKITDKDLNKFIYSITMGGTPESPDLADYKDVPKSQFLDMYLESLVLEQESKKLGVTVADSELDAMVSEKFPWMEKSNILLPDVKNYQLYLARKDKLMSKVLGDKSGYWIMARNDLYLPDTGKEITPENKQKTDELKTYTESFIKDVYAKLRARTLTIQQAVELEVADAKIGKNAPSENSGLHSLYFDSEMFKERAGLLSDAKILGSISALKAGEYTEPVHLVNEEGTDIGWYIIYIEKSDANPTGQSYDEWLTTKNTAYGVKTYLEAK